MIPRTAETERRTQRTGIEHHDGRPLIWRPRSDADLCMHYCEAHDHRWSHRDRRCVQHEATPCGEVRPGWRVITALTIWAVLVFGPTSALAIIGGGAITGSLDGSQISANKAWISPSGANISFLDGRFELRYLDPAPEGTLYLGGTILDSHLDLAPIHPLLNAHDGSVLTVHLDLDFIEPYASPLFDRFSTLTIEFTYPSGGLILLGDGFVAHPGYLNITPTNPVPEPATWILLGSGLMGLAWGRWRW